MKKTACLSLLLSLSLLLLISCNSRDKRYVKQIPIAQNISDSKKMEYASHVIPTDLQLERQQLESAALISFGINTFTGREWGTGNDDLSLFDPTNLNAEQWIKTLSDAGFKLVIVIAKHYDGFCIWPTRTTPYSIASTPWKAGAGDLLKEIQEACEKHNIKFGIYLSTEDRSAERLGIGDPNKLFMEQLEELLTNYGDIYELWIDNTSLTNQDNSRLPFNWKEIKKLISTLQPKVLLAGVGDDIRFVDQKTLSTENPSWSITSITPLILQEITENSPSNETGRIEDLKNQLANATKLYWYPSETFVSLRPSWFYKTEQDNSIKSLAELIDIYYQTKGNNTMLLLGISPSKEGVIIEGDSLRLMELRNYIDEFSSKNLIEMGEFSNLEQLSDTLLFSIRNQPINTLEITEDIKNGQRIKAFKVQLLLNGTWTTIAQGSTIGYKKMIKLNRIAQSDSIKLITNTLSDRSYISDFRAFYMEAPRVSQSTKVFSEIGRYRWRIISPTEEGENIIDNNITTSWVGKDPLIINFRKEESFSGFIYTPSPTQNSYILEYSLHISDDAMNWTTLIDHDEFGNIEKNPIQQYTRFGKKVSAQYIKLTVHKTNSVDNFYAIAEFGLVK